MNKLLCEIFIARLFKFIYIFCYSQNIRVSIQYPWILTLKNMKLHKCFDTFFSEDTWPAPRLLSHKELVIFTSLLGKPLAYSQPKSLHVLQSFGQSGLRKKKSRFEEFWAAFDGGPIFVHLKLCSYNLSSTASSIKYVMYFFSSMLQSWEDTGSPPLTPFSINTVF